MGKFRTFNGKAECLSRCLSDRFGVECLEHPFAVLWERVGKQA